MRAPHPSTLLTLLLGGEAIPLLGLRLSRRLLRPLDSNIRHHLITIYQGGDLVGGQKMDREHLGDNVRVKGIA